MLECCIPVTAGDVAETEGKDLLLGTNEIQNYCTFREHFDFAHIEVCQPKSEMVIRGSEFSKMLIISLFGNGTLIKEMCTIVFFVINSICLVQY